MKLKDFIAALLECQAQHGGEVEVKVNSFDIERISRDEQLMMVPVDVSGYNEEFDCIELF